MLPQSLGVCICKSRMLLLRIFVGSPVLGKCLSTEQVVALMLPNNAPAQVHVLGAVCEEGINARGINFRVNPDLSYSLCLLPCVLPILPIYNLKPHPGSLLSFGLHSASKHRLTEQRG